MNNERDDQLSGLLAQAVRQLVETPQAINHPPDLDAIVLGELSRADDFPARTTTAVFTQQNQKRPLSLLIKCSLASLVIVAGAVTWLGSMGGTNSVYGAVAKRLGTVRSIVYRVQWIDEARLVNAVEGDGDKVIFVTPSHHRIERKNGSIMIIDGELEKAIDLSPTTKKAMVMSGQMAKDMAAISRGPEALLDTLKKHFSISPEQPKGVEGLGKRTIAGMQAQGLRSTINGEVVEAWIDSTTSLPVEVRICLVIPALLSGLSEQEARVWRIMSAIEYDVAVDPSLLSTEAPAEYTVIQMPELSIPKNTAAPSLTDLIDLLRLCARHNDATFPASLSINDTPGSCMAIMKRFADSQEKVWESGNAAQKQAALAAATEFGAALGRVTPFLFSLRPENKLRYVGEGVKLDTPDRPILWFSPQGNAQYQVVYADLSVKEVAESSLPKLPEAAPSKSTEPISVRGTSPRVTLPQSAVKDYQILQSIRKTGKQDAVRFLELQWMTEFIAGSATADSKDDSGRSRFAFLDEFRNLEGLKVGGSLTENDLKVIGQLRNLKKLSLDGIQILEASDRKRFLEGTDLRHLSQLKDLEMLDLTQSNFSGGLKHLQGLPKLHTLILSSFENLNDASVAQLKELPHLQTLVLAAVYANNSEITITDAGLASLKDLPSLRTLYVEYHGKWTMPVEKLQALLPAVKVLRGFEEETSSPLINKLRQLGLDLRQEVPPPLPMKKE